MTTAQVDGTTWNYTYDANGSLTEVLPNGNPGNGAKRYTYNAAGNLVQVEAHNGTDWSTQAEMDYNGLGQRLSMDTAGVIAHYVMDGDRPLAAETGGNTNFYLYGLGAIGEKTTAWNYSLPDGTNTPRQLTDVSGEVTLTSRYTPWGDTLDTYGTGNTSTLPVLVSAAPAQVSCRDFHPQLPLMLFDSMMGDPISRDRE